MKPNNKCKGGSDYCNGKQYLEPLLLSRESHNHIRDFRKKQHLVNSYGSKLDALDDWQAWFTFTWRDRNFSRSSQGIFRMDDRYDNISVPAIRRAMERWTGIVQPESVWWCSESGERGHRNHAHGLINFGLEGDDLEAKAKRAWELAYRWFGRSQVEPYIKEKGAAFYVGKYVAKQMNDHDYVRTDNRSSTKGANESSNVESESGIRAENSASNSDNGVPGVRSYAYVRRALARQAKKSP